MVCFPTMAEMCGIGRCKPLQPLFLSFSLVSRRSCFSQTLTGIYTHTQQITLFVFVVCFVCFTFSITCLTYGLFGKFSTKCASLVGEHSSLLLCLLFLCTKTTIKLGFPCYVISLFFATAQFSFFGFLRTLPQFGTQCFLHIFLFLFSQYHRLIVLG